MKPILRTLPSPRDIWARSSGMVRLVLYLAGVEVFLWLVQQLFRLAGWTNAADTLRTWLISIGFICFVLATYIVLRWLRKKVMWSLRNRLIVTYVFIGVIPVLLLLGMGIFAGELLSGQFASFLATADLQHRIDSLDTANSALAHVFANRLKQGANINSFAGFAPTERFPHRQVTVWYNGSSVVIGSSGPERNAEPTAMPAGGNDVQTIAEEHEKLYLRSSRSVAAGSGKLTVISSVPLDDALLHDITADIGQVMLSKRSTSPNAAGEASRASERDAITLRAGTRPPARNQFDVGVDFFAPITLMDWQTGEKPEAWLSVSTRPSLLLDRLFANLGTNANAILVVLGLIAAALGLIELLALIIGVRLTRTMTRSVHGLYGATQHINRGDLSHRIKVESQDQLAELETSFNSMSNSLERLIAEQKEKQRMESELAIAHEVQEQLFPREGSDVKGVEVHGVCRPARTVSGDYYDFLPLGGEKLCIAVGDISGKGISAALLMATIHSAVRVYEMGRVPAREQLVAVGGAAMSLACDSPPLVPAGIIESPAAVLALLNRHLFHSTPPEKYATMFFGLWDSYEHSLKYSNAGHIPPFIVRQNGSIEQLTVGGTVVGLFDDTLYDEATVTLAAGDLFVAYSDGLTEPENEFGEFGSERLIELVHGSRHMTLGRISEIVTTSVADWIGAAEQPDDVTLVLARATNI
jgi:sigma-B regulation protein RsbU (phosphoserine phosphatase)